MCTPASCVFFQERGDYDSGYGFSFGNTVLPIHLLGLMRVFGASFVLLWIIAEFWKELLVVKTEHLDWLTREKKSRIQEAVASLVSYFWGFVRSIRAAGETVLHECVPVIWHEVCWKVFYCSLIWHCHFNPLLINFLIAIMVSSNKITFCEFVLFRPVFFVFFMMWLFFDRLRQNLACTSMLYVETFIAV